ncbi:hypothetical protein E2C01_077460 [Portunus trituberculatus]|uniref:Uncharacterized protein n=1 Tax=Portunus trituberculatus TaxID=210409 RepID=A0A5B7IPS6_PORTR|nr:hypothetical protein [Portunus trituberculatus]
MKRRVLRTRTFREAAYLVSYFLVSLSVYQLTCGRSLSRASVTASMHGREVPSPCIAATPTPNLLTIFCQANVTLSTFLEANHYAPSAFVIGGPPEITFTSCRGALKRMLFVLMKRQINCRASLLTMSPAGGSPGNELPRESAPEKCPWDKTSRPTNQHPATKPQAPPLHHTSRPESGPAAHHHACASPRLALSSLLWPSP